MPTNLASVQDSTQESPLKRILPEVLRKSVGVTEIKSMDNNTDFETYTFRSSTLD